MRIIVQVGNVLLSALLTAMFGVFNVFGLAQMSFAGIDHVPWQWLELATFVWFCFFVGLAFYKMYARIQQLENARPEIATVVPTGTAALMNARGAVIDVTNKGAEGRFQAQVEVLRHTENYLSPSETRYDAWWEDEDEREVIIKMGHTRRIKLASFEQSASSNLPSGCLHLYRNTPSGMNYHTTSSYSIFSKDQSVIPEFELRVAISSSPTAKNGVVMKVLRIRADMKVEEWS